MVANGTNKRFPHKSEPILMFLYVFKQYCYKGFLVVSMTKKQTQIVETKKGANILKQHD